LLPPCELVPFWAALTPDEPDDVVDDVLDDVLDEVPADVFDDPLDDVVPLPDDDEVVELVPSVDVVLDVWLLVVPVDALADFVVCAVCVTPASTAAVTATPATAVVLPATATRRSNRSAEFVMAPTIAGHASAPRHRSVKGFLTLAGSRQGPR
jgi:hypothetical protein